MAVFLVTGSAGFIGSNLLRALAEAGHEVRAFDLSQNQDVRRIEDCRRACNGVDFVLHHAALASVPQSILEPVLYHDNNVSGTLNLLVAAKEAGVKRFVFASSASVYGDGGEGAAKEEHWPNPKSPYAAGKFLGEQYCRLFHVCYALPTVCLRYFNVFGPHQNPSSGYAAAIPAFISAFLAGGSPTIFGDGSQTRDFVFVDDVVRANIAAVSASDEALGRVINVGSGQSVSILRLAEAIGHETHSRAKIHFASERAGDVKHSLGDVRTMQKILGIETVTSLEEGLRKTIAWQRHAV